MKYWPIIFTMVFILEVVPVEAMSGVPHLVKGTVQSVDESKHVLVIASAERDQPLLFVLKAGRTRLRRNGKQATIGQLEVGQAVRVYYRKESGEWVATEVSWKAPTSPKPGTP